MRLVCRLLILLVACIGARYAFAANSSNSQQDPSNSLTRIALVIGNSAYPSAALANPANDAKDMTIALRKLGFEVIEKVNVSQKELNRAIAQFGEQLRGDTIALFFYAGHGMQVKGKNYLIPVDAQITSESAVRAETVDVDTVMDQLSVSPLNIVILDACRNNPFERRFRNVGGGLAQMDAPKGSLIAYATAPGKVASDGTGRNGLYTQELLKHIQTPGLPLEAVFKRVRNGVIMASAEAQTPWESSSLTGDFYFVPPEPPSSVQVSFDKEALQKVLNEQKASTDRAVEEALKKANEQAAQERLELKNSMERLLQEALARQAIQLAEERSRRNEASKNMVMPETKSSPVVPTSIGKEATASSSEVAPAPSVAMEMPTAQSSKLAMAVPTSSIIQKASELPKEVGMVADARIHPGDEWEYATRDNMFGKNGKLILRVKAVSPQGVLEEVIWNGKPGFEWVFGYGFSAIGTPNESEFLIAPHWIGDTIKTINVEGGVGTWQTGSAWCRLYDLKIIGTEKIVLGVGTFDSIRIEGRIAGNSYTSGTPGYGEIKFWYSPMFGRLLKQQATFRGMRQKFDETIELVAIRPTKS